jgi:hypothetical protein
LRHATIPRVRPMPKLVKHFNRPDLSRTDGIKKPPKDEPLPETAAAVEYRTAYADLAGRDPSKLAGLPHPDSPVPFDPGEALRTLRRIDGLRGVPAVELKA